MPRRECQPAGRAGLAVQQPLWPGLEPAVPFAVRRQLLVADQPVQPEVRDLDHQMIHARSFQFAGLRPCPPAIREPDLNLYVPEPTA